MIFSGRVPRRSGRGRVARTLSCSGRRFGRSWHIFAYSRSSNFGLARFRWIGRGADGNLEVEDARERLRLTAPVRHRPRHLERHPVDAGRLTLYRRVERLLPARRGKLQQLVAHRERAGLLPLVLAEESRLVEERLASALTTNRFFRAGGSVSWSWRAWLVETRGAIRRPIADTAETFAPARSRAVSVILNSRPAKSFSCSTTRPTCSVLRA